MLKYYKYRLYPNKQQRSLIEKHFGCVRFVYNWGLHTKNSAYLADKKVLNYYDLSSLLTLLKISLPWLNEVNAQSLQNALRNLDNAFVRFFKKKSGFPAFKSKKSNKRSFQISQGIKVDFSKKYMSIPKLKNIKIVYHRKFQGNIKQATLLKYPSNKYYISILVNTDEIPKIKNSIKEETSIGIDMGLSYFAVLSNGIKIDNPKFFRSLELKLKAQQRKFNRKQIGSKNRDKQRIKIAKIYEKITSQRMDFLNKITFRLIHDNQVDTLCIENLNISGMLKNHALAKSISDASWFKFKQFLEYKCLWYGKNLISIGRFEPSSKMCICGSINKNLTFEKSWICPTCKILIQDRDIHAATNIKKFALHSQNLVGQVLPEFKPAEKSWFQTSSMKQEISFEKK